MLGILEGRTSFDIDIHKVKLKVTQNEIREKKCMGFLLKIYKLWQILKRFSGALKVER